MEKSEKSHDSADKVVEGGRTPVDLHQAGNATDQDANAATREWVSTQLDAFSVKTKTSLLEREHRIIPAIISIRETWDGPREHRIAAFKGLLFCLSGRAARASVIASVAGVGVLGAFFAWQANVLLREQNYRINVQSHLIEAQRRSTLIFELSSIIEEIGREKTEIAKPLPALSLASATPHNRQAAAVEMFKKTPEAQDGVISERLSSLYTPSEALAGRIAALALSFRPYYYVDYRSTTRLDRSTRDVVTLPEFLSTLGAASLPPQSEVGALLTDRPLSPERGLLLLYLLSLNVNLLPISNAGATFDSADLSKRQIYGAFMPSVILEQIDFRGTVFSTVRFSTTEPNLGAGLSGADFTCASFLNTIFAGASIERAKFAYVSMRTFNFEAEGVGRSFDPRTLRLADLTMADFHGARVRYSTMPWLSEGVTAPKGFDRKRWNVVAVPGTSASAQGVFELQDRNDRTAYEAERSRVCGAL